MNREYFECARECGRRGGIWKFIAGVIFILLIIMSVAAVAYKLRCDKYRDALIDVSERFPNTPEQEEELARIRREEWSKSHAPANQKTDEERMEENRVVEEE